MKKDLIYKLIFLAVVAGGIFILIRYSRPHKDTEITPPVVEQPAAPAPAPTPVFHYIEIIGGCDHAFVGTCVNMRAGPGTEYPVVLHMRTGMVMKVEATTVSGGEHEWYKIVPDKKIRYPERVTSDWYVAVNPEVVRPFDDVGDQMLYAGTKISTTKRIVVDLSDQTLSAYDGDTLFIQEAVSTGIGDTATEIGSYRIYQKTPSRYMQGPVPDVSDEYYDLPGIPWDMYFTFGGDVLHGAYWHNSFGSPKSHGCVNQSPENAKKLYFWAELGTPVVVEE